MTRPLRRYEGPPGDEHEYWLPRDRDALDAAWDAWYAEHSEQEIERAPDDTPVDLPF